MADGAKSYTGRGDSGRSRLGNGECLPKSHANFEAVGTLDELNSVVGMAKAGLGHSDGQLDAIQRDLFETGALLSGAGKKKEGEAMARLFESRLRRLEGWIDGMDSELLPLRHFILPGGSALAARLHHARAVCRRAERVVEACESVSKHIVLPYLNRLSSYFFTRARFENHRSGVNEQEWQG